MQITATYVLHTKTRKEWTFCDFSFASTWFKYRRIHLKNCDLFWDKFARKSTVLKARWYSPKTVLQAYFVTAVGSGVVSWSCGRCHMTSGCRHMTSVLPRPPK